MRAKREIFFLLAFMLTWSLAGCGLDDQAVLKSTRDYFPAVTLWKFQPQVLWVQTQVDGVTAAFAEKTFDHFLEEANQEALQRSLGLANFDKLMAQKGYVFFVLGFRGGVIVYDRPRHLRWTLNWPQARAWMAKFGVSSMDQIQVVRE